MEHCGDDFLATLAESMQDTEDWDNVEAMESEACGALAELLDQDLLKNSDVKDNESSRSHIHIIPDSPECQKHQNFTPIDSSSDSEEAEFMIPNNKDIKFTSKHCLDGSSQDLSPSSNIHHSTSRVIFLHIVFSMILTSTVTSIFLVGCKHHVIVRLAQNFSNYHMVKWKLQYLVIFL